MEQDYSEKEVERRMKDAIRRAQKTPPQSHKNTAVKKAKSLKRKAKKKG